MLINLFEIRDKLEADKIENLRFARHFDGIGEASPFAVCRTINTLAKGFVGVIDCTKCGNCCRSIVVHVSGEDRRRLARRFNMPEQNFRDTYCTKTEQGWAFTDLQCPFLENKKCSVYDDRPHVCREFPHLDLELMCLNHLAVPKVADMVKMSYRCPIVFNIMEELKSVSGFRTSAGNNSTRQAVDPIAAMIGEDPRAEKEAHDGSKNSVQVPVAATV